MIFSNVNVTKVLTSNSYENSNSYDENDYNVDENMEMWEGDSNFQMHSLVEHNIDTLHRCHDSKTRYRIRHGVYCGKKVAVVVKAETFLDKLFSYIPSGCLLKRRLCKPLKHFIEGQNSIADTAMDLLRLGGKIPGMSPADVSAIYSPTAVYNPWPHLHKWLASQYAQTGQTLSQSDLDHGRSIHFYDQNAAHAIFSNMTRRKDNKPLALVEVPGVVTTASCSEILFQAGKYHNNPSARKAILKKTSGTDACIIAQKKDSDGKYVEKVDADFFSDRRDIKLTLKSNHRDIQLMLKLVRTRAQQDNKFRKALTNTGQKFIYELTPSDIKWGCVIAPSGGYIGDNLLGQILMQVRQEITDDQIPEIPVEDVIRDRGIEPQKNPTSFEESISEEHAPFFWENEENDMRQQTMHTHSDSDGAETYDWIA